MGTTSSEEIKYCVAAFLDLQGFSHHLEVGSDIRTIIGQQAIVRLQTLENAIRFLHEEQQNTSFFFPYRRINDSIIFTIDLSEALLPNIGETYRDGLTEDDWERLYDIKPMQLDKFPIDLGDSSQTFKENYKRKRMEYTLPLLKFLGLVSRIHQRINIEDRNNSFPGIKTIISTGFRRRFFGIDGNEDSFSANFAFSNAYTAQGSLKGGGLFVDNHIIEMMDADLRILNIAKLACLVYQNPIYSPLKALSEPQKEWVETDITELSLFRKKYHFRRVNPNPLTYLQFADDLENRNDMYEWIGENIKVENIDEKIKNGDHFNILKMPYDMGKKMYERFERELQERWPPVTIHCFGCAAAVEAQWKFCVQCGIDLLN